MARGELRIYLGAAPGVGKTFAMLNEGRRRAARGTDVVVGIVETHGRPRTAEQLEGLEVLPRREVQHRGATFTELDVDGVLARRPKVVLVDELAHTNAPGSRNDKRWQDIDELLAAGIDVISTVNIQHLEGLNDVVEGITGIRQQETVPDAWVRAADQIEIVDMAPEALRRRMAHGNIYPAERIDAALGNWFRVGNLAALRELALLWLADRVEDDLQAYRARHGIDAPWETRERVVVAVTGAPGGDVLVRRAARMAVRAKAELVAVHVRRDDGVRGPSSELLARHLAVVEDLGGRFLEVSADDIATALLAVARAENATQIVLGATRQSRVAQLVNGSVVDRVLRGAGGIDVHVVPTAAEEDLVLPRPARWRNAIPVRRRRLAWATAVVLPPAISAALVPFRDDLLLDTVLFALLVGSLAVAALGAAGPALLAAVSSFALANWYFTEPVRTFTVAEPEHLFTLVVFLGVNATVTGYVALSARRSAEAARARAEAATLARLAAGDDAAPDRLGHVVGHVREAFDVRAAALLGRDGPDQPWHTLAAEGLDAPSAPEAADVPIDVPVVEGEAVLALAGHVDPVDRGVLSAFASRLGDALDRRRMAESVLRAEEIRRGDELRAAILAAVSHDLRTPLAGIKAAVSSLLADDIEWPPEIQREFHESIDAETDRLTDLVSNLLDMSRLTAGAVSVRAVDIGVDEVVAGAVASLGEQVGPGAVDVDVPEELPAVRTDPALVERVVANVLANALRWSPEGVPVRVDAGEVPGAVLLRVVDHGPGMPREDRGRAFEPFQRLGDGGDPRGLGLGLAVARGFADAVGAELSVEDTPGGGTTMVLRLPLEGGT